MSKGKIKLFNFVNSIVVMFIFTAVYVFLDKNTIYSGAPAFLYWLVNNAIYTKYSVIDNSKINSSKPSDKKAKEIHKVENKGKDKEVKMKAKKDSKIIIISICVVIAIAIISGSILINTYIKLENKNKNEVDRQDNLYDCITDAKSARTSLWDSNCTKQKDGSCTIDSDSKTVDWIEKRYQQDLNSCYQLYGN